MKCIHPEKDCPYRVRVCENGKCWDNCNWSCPYDEPFSECELAQATWGCLYNCIYEALDPRNDCPFKQELQRMLLHDIMRKALQKKKKRGKK